MFVEKGGAVKRPDKSGFNAVDVARVMSPQERRADGMHYGGFRLNSGVGFTRARVAGIGVDPYPSPMGSPGGGFRSFRVDRVHPRNPRRMRNRTEALPSIQEGRNRKSLQEDPPLHKKQQPCVAPFMATLQIQLGKGSYQKVYLLSIEIYFHSVRKIGAGPSSAGFVFPPRRGSKSFQVVKGIVAQRSSCVFSVTGLTKTASAGQNRASSGSRSAEGGGKCRFPGSLPGINALPGDRRVGLAHRQHRIRSSQKLSCGGFEVRVRVVRDHEVKEGVKKVQNAAAFEGDVISRRR